jgi:hypothetical protein
MIEKLKKINFPTSESFDNKKIAVFLTAFNRTAMLEKVVESVNLSDELENVPIFIYLDGGTNSKQDECLEIVKKIKFKNKYLIKRGVNFGCDRNTLEMFNDMFVHLNFDYAFHVEDDFVFCKNYFKYCFDEFSRIKRNIDPNIGVFQGFSICFKTPEEKKQHLSAVVPTEKDHLWGCLYSKEAYLALKDRISDYEKIVDTFPTNGFSKEYMLQIARESIAECYNTIFDNSQQPMSDYIKNTFYDKFNQHFTAGWDGAFVLGLASTKYTRYMPEVNRMINIGDVGHHYNRQAFQHHKLDQIKLDEVWN